MQYSQTNNSLNYRKVSIEPINTIKASFNMIRDQYLFLVLIFFVGNIIAGSVPIVLFGPIFCGFYLCLIGKMAGNKINFDLLFKGFDYFKESLLASFVYFLVVFIIILPPVCILILTIIFFTAQTAQNSYQPGSNVGMNEVVVILVGILFLFLIVVAILVNIFLAFTFILIVDKRLAAMEAIKLSIKAAKKNFWGLLGLNLLFFLLGIMGLCACYFGVFLIPPLHHGAILIIYKKIFDNPIPYELQQQSL